MNHYSDSKTYNIHQRWPPRFNKHQLPNDVKSNCTRVKILHTQDLNSSVLYANKLDMKYECCVEYMEIIIGIIRISKVSTDLY